MSSRSKTGAEESLPIVGVTLEGAILGKGPSAGSEG